MNMDIFENIRCIICISDFETHEVLYLNRYARDYFNLPDISANLKSDSLLAKDEKSHRIYLDMSLENGEMPVVFISPLCDQSRPTMIESTCIQYDGKRVRLDLIRQIAENSNNSESLYTMLFESAYLQLEANYHGIAFPEENIRECLTAALMLYEADSAYVLEIDEELDAGQYLFYKVRDGFVTADELTDGMLFSSIFTDIIKKGEAFLYHTEDLKDSHAEEYEWLCKHNIVNSMGVPFTTRAEELVAFFCVNNVQRFWNKMSFLNLSAKTLANEIRAIHMFRPQVSKSSTNGLSNGEVVIKFFGGFEITTSQGTLDLSDYSMQCNRLLLYLIKNKNRIIPIRDITDILWPDQLTDNPYNMVKGIAFRVRKTLDSIGLGKLLVTKSGTYTINDSLVIIQDIDYFDSLCNKIHSGTLSAYEKQYLYEKVVQLYKGDMLPNYESEIWLIGWIGYYQLKYLSILKEYMLLLTETGQYSKVFEVYSEVQNIAYSEGDIYEILIDVLLRQNKLEIAKNYYLSGEKFLSAEQRKKFLDIWNKYKNFKSTDLQ